MLDARRGASATDARITSRNAMNARIQRAARTVLLRWVRDGPLDEEADMISYTIYLKVSSASVSGGEGQEQLTKSERGRWEKKCRIGHLASDWLEDE